MLKWYDDAQEHAFGHAPRGSIPIASAMISEAAVDAEHSHAIRIFSTANGREYVMAAPSAAKHRAWLKALVDRVDEARAESEGDPRRVVMEGYLHKRGGGTLVDPEAENNRPRGNLDVKLLALHFRQGERGRTS